MRHTSPDLRMDSSCRSAIRIVALRERGRRCGKNPARQHYRDTTTVIVAQRISSLRHADLILVLHDGKVLGMGNHEQLLESCEEYRIIARTQMGDGREGL